MLFKTDELLNFTQKIKIWCMLTIQNLNMHYFKKEVIHCLLPDNQLKTKNEQLLGGQKAMVMESSACAASYVLSLLLE